MSLKYVRDPQFDTAANLIDVAIGRVRCRIDHHTPLLLAKTLRSTTFKLALICIAFFGVLVLGLLGHVYYSTDSYVRSRSDRAIMVEQRLLQKVYNERGLDGLVATINQRTTDELFEGNIYLLADPSFAPMVGNLKVWPSALHTSRVAADFSAGEWKHDIAERPLLRATSETLADGHHLLVGRDVGDLETFLGKVQTAFGSVIVLLLFLAGFCSVSVTRRTVGRIESINATSRAIMQTGLGNRIPLCGTRDEWDQLAENLNSMFDRIEYLMGEVKQVTDNVAHDLRTPLARLRARLEKAYNAQRNGASDQLLISDVMADLDIALGMFSSLLRISQIEAYDRNATLHIVSLTEIAKEVVELFDAAAEEKSVTLKAALTSQVLVNGDRDLLFDAVANLIDNAIKYALASGQVTVKIMQSDGLAVLSVADDGPGIPTDQHQNVFKRFYRLEDARRSHGNGLGLSLVAAVARLHGATIKMLNASPGLDFQLHFPHPEERQAIKDERANQTEPQFWKTV